MILLEYDKYIWAICLLLNEIKLTFKKFENNSKNIRVHGEKAKIKIA